MNTKLLIQNGCKDNQGQICSGNISKIKCHKEYCMYKVSSLFHKEHNIPNFCTMSLYQLYRIIL